MYTLPNFPFPKGRPISNEERVKGEVGRCLFVLINGKRSAEGEKGEEEELLTGQRRNYLELRVLRLLQ